MTSSNPNDKLEYGVNGNQSGLVQNRFQFHITEDQAAAIQTGGQSQNLNSLAVPSERGNKGAKCEGKKIKIKIQKKEESSDEVKAIMKKYHEEEERQQLLNERYSLQEQLRRLMNERLALNRVLSK